MVAILNRTEESGSAAQLAEPRAMVARLAKTFESATLTEVGATFTGRQVFPGSRKKWKSGR